MKNIIKFCLVFLIVISSVSRSNAVASGDLTILKGRCAPESHIAEGAIGEDLTKRRSSFFCDSVVISVFSDNPKHVMIQFADSKSNHARQIGYAGMMDNGEIMNVYNVYLEPGEPIPVADGACKFFFMKQDISGIACGAKIDQLGRRIVPIVTFDAGPHETTSSLFNPTSNEKADKNENDDPTDSDSDSSGLSQCIRQKVQSDQSQQYSSYDGGKSAADLLMNECHVQFQAWINTCVAGGLTPANCRVNSLLFTQTALRYVLKR